MINKNFAKAGWIVMGLCLVIVLSSSDAFAWNGGRVWGRGHEDVRVGHERYHYRDGRFYRPNLFGFDVTIVAAPDGAIVTSIPFGHRTFVAGDVEYYYYDDTYYRACSGGYIVVPAPVGYVNPQPQPQASAGDTVTINVPNSNGSYTAVNLIRHDNGYIGPQGEYYPDHPTVEQLKALYGK